MKLKYCKRCPLSINQIIVCTDVAIKAKKANIKHKANLSTLTL